MSNVDPKTKVTAAQTRKNIAAYQALTNMPDYKANNSAHSREAAEAAYQPLIAAERKAVIDKATSAARADAGRCAGQRGARTQHREGGRARPRLRPDRPCVHGTAPGR